jgi:hypothetical protein
VELGCGVWNVGVKGVVCEWGVGCCALRAGRVWVVEGLWRWGGGVRVEGQIQGAREEGKGAFPFPAC